MNDDMFDFGFTAVNEDELTAVQDAQKAVGDTAVEARTSQDKLDRLYNAITPLLNNLKANPEKDYIYWPNRTAILQNKIEELNSLQDSL